MKYTIAEISASLEAAYYQLRQVSEWVHEWTGTVANAERALADRKAFIISEHADDPKALGSNEAARAATIDAMCVPEREALRKALDTLRGHRHAQEQARLEVDLWRAQVRCAVVATAARGGLVEA